MNVWLKKTSSHAHLHGGGAECIHTVRKLRAMTITMEALQHLLGEMHKMQSDSLANLMKQQNDALAVWLAAAAGTLGSRTPEALAVRRVQR